MLVSQFVGLSSNLEICSKSRNLLANFSPQHHALISISPSVSFFHIHPLRQISSSLSPWTPISLSVSFGGSSEPRKRKNTYLETADKETGVRFPIQWGLKSLDLSCSNYISIYIWVCVGVYLCEFTRKQVKVENERVEWCHNES